MKNTRMKNVEQIFAFISECNLAIVLRYGIIYNHMVFCSLRNAVLRHCFVMLLPDPSAGSILTSNTRPVKLLSLFARFCNRKSASQGTVMRPSPLILAKKLSDSLENSVLILTVTFKTCVASNLNCHRTNLGT